MATVWSRLEVLTMINSKNDCDTHNYGKRQPKHQRQCKRETQEIINTALRQQRYKKYRPQTAEITKMLCEALEITKWHGETVQIPKRDKRDTRDNKSGTRDSRDYNTSIRDNTDYK